MGIGVGGRGAVGGVAAVTTGGALHAGHGGHALDAPDVIGVMGAAEGMGSAVIGADDGAARAVFVGDPHFPLSQMRSPLQSVSFPQPSAFSLEACEHPQKAQSSDSAMKSVRRSKVRIQGPWGRGDPWAPVAAVVVSRRGREGRRGPREARTPDMADMQKRARPRRSS